MREYGLQLYSIRNAITENYHDALRQVAEMGYKMAELYGGMGPGAQTLRSWMDEFHPSFHFVSSTDICANQHALPWWFA